MLYKYIFKIVSLKRPHSENIQKHVAPQAFSPVCEIPLGT